VRRSWLVASFWGWVLVGGCVRIPAAKAPHTEAAIRGSRPFSLCLPSGTSIEVGERPVDVVVLVDARGKPALVVANEGSNDLSLVRRDGQRWTEVQRIATAPAPFALAMADIDGDTAIDVVVIHRASPVASLHLRNADGTLRAARTVVLDEPALAVAAADLDGDGDIELSFTSGTVDRGTLRIVSVDGNGVVHDEMRRGVEDHPIKVVAGDIREGPARELAIFHTQETVQTIVTPGRHPDPGPYRRPLTWLQWTLDGTLVDMFGDSGMEALGVSVQSFVDDSGKLAIYSYQSHDDFVIHTVADVPEMPHRVFAHDIDGDARPEVLVFAGRASALERFPELRTAKSLPPLDPRLGETPTLTVFGLTAGALETRAAYAVDGLSFAIHDLTEDGAPELVAVQGRLHVHRNFFSPRPAAPGLARGVRSLLVHDVDGDGDDEVVALRAVDCALLVGRPGALGLRPLGRERGPRECSPATPDAGHPIPYLGRRIIGEVRRTGRPDMDLLLSDRLSEHVQGPTGEMHSVDDPELLLYLLRIDVWVRLGALHDMPGERTSTRYHPDGVRPISQDLAHTSDVAASASGDLDGDGDIEILIVDRLRRLHVLWGRPDGSFAEPVLWDIGPVRALAVRDLDGDHVDELVALSDREAALKIYAPSGSAVPQPVALFGTGAGVDQLAVADIDDDHRPDIVLTDRFTEQLTALRLEPCAAR
jgi:hypothetical protein